MMRFLARLLVRWRWTAIAVWVALGIAAFFRARETPHELSTRGGSNHPTEASQVDDILRNRFGGSLGEFLAVTISSPESLNRPEARDRIQRLEQILRAQPYVHGVLSFRSTGDSVFTSRDGRAEFLVVALAVPTADSSGGLVQPIRQLTRAAFAGSAGGDYEVTVTGRAALDLDVRAISREDSVRGELLSLPLTLIVLVFAFGALVAATLPVIVGFLAITISLAIIGILARITPMSVFVLNMTTMIGLGVGIDYSLLVVTRFREELSRGLSRRDAAIRTVHTAGSAVITSGITVAVGFAALLLTPLIETRSVGLGGVVVVFVAVALSVTLLPAILAVLGRTIDIPRSVARRLAWYHAPMVWEKWARTLSRHPLRALTLGVTAIAILTAPVFWIRIGLPAHNWWPSGTEAGRGLDALDRMGVSGLIIPVRVTIEVPEGERAVGATYLRGLRALSDSLRADPRVRDVKSVVDIRPGASILGLSLLYSDMAQARSQYPDFLDAYLSRDNRVALLDIFLSDTTTLTSSMDLVRHVRALTGGGGIRGLNGTTAKVGGFIAASVDLQDDLLARFPRIILLILLTTGVMLAIAFRSVLVPIKAIVMNTLSVSATFGLLVLVFQHGVGSRLLGVEGPTLAIYVIVPVLVFAVVFGLSMDYEVFLLTRMKEVFDKTGKNDQATMEGLSATASVITSAALIMIMVFGVFAFARLLVMKFVGFGLAVAVFLDATIIRMVLVPSIMHLAGEWNWWPGRRPANKRGEP